MRLRSLKVLGSASVMLAVAGACGGEDEAPRTPASADEISFEPFASTRQLGEADLALLTNVEPEGRLTFASEPAGLAGITEGQVVLAGISPATPHGLLRFVTRVDRSAGFVLETTAAPLQAAFRKLHVKAHRKAEPLVDGSPIALTDLSPLGLRPQFTLARGKGEATQTYDIIVFDGDGDVGTTNDQVKIEATLGGGFDYEVAIDLDWGIVDKLPETVVACIKSVAEAAFGGEASCRPQDLMPEAKATFHADPFLTLDARAVGAASLSYEKDIEVGVIHLPPFALGPIVFTPVVDILARVEGGASARFEVSTHARADFESSLVVSSKSPGTPQYEPPSLKDLDARADEPVLDLHASAEVSVGARLTAPAFGMAGPYATVSGVARIAASPTSDPCFKVTLGIDTELGLRVTTPRLPGIGALTIADVSTGKLSVVEREIASGACTIPPDPPLPPGSGPTPTAYRSPTFTPWAKAIASPDIDGVPAVSIAGLSFPDLVPTVDGRYLMSGESALALHKIDPEGAVTWLARLGTPDPVRRNRVLRSVPATNGGILTLLRPEDTAAFVLAKLGQSGALEWSREYLSPEGCDPVVTGLFKDPGRGYVVLGQCRPDRGFFVRLDERGAIVRARVYAEGGARLARPLLATTTSDGELVLVGEVAQPSELEWIFVTRLDADDRPTASMAFSCPERIVAQPLAAIPAEQGGVTVVGTANGVGVVARIRRDNTLGFVRYPNVGIGAASSLAVTSVAELSTTGMVIGANAGNVTESPTHWIVLAGLDSGGSTLWARRYLVADSANPITFPALRLTDDGGIFATAISTTPDGQVGTAYAMKVFAKDGLLGDGQPLVSEPVTLAEHTCETTTRPLAPTLTDVVLTSEPSPIVRLP